MPFDSESNVNFSAMPESMIRVCKLSGVEAEMKKNQLLKFRDCEKFLEQAIREARTAQRHHGYARIGELAARSVLIVCDITIMVLENVTGAAGMAVGKVYGQAKLITQSATTGLDKKAAFSMLAESQVTIVELSMKAAGADKGANIVGIVKNLIMTADALWSSGSEFASGSSGDAGISGAINGAAAQLENMRARIRKLELELQNC